MTDQELEQRLRNWYRAEIGEAERAPATLRASVAVISHTRSASGLRMPWRFSTLNTATRFAAAAVIGVLAVGGSLFLLQRGQPDAGSASPTPGVTASPGTPASTTTPTPATPTGPPGPIGTGRQIHTTTRLGDGHILVAGGYALGDGALASAVLYDPGANTFSPTGPLADARGAHTATLLSNGRVLVAGGGPASWPGALAGIGDPFLASAELYDPTTRAFSLTGSMATPREAHTATRLADGRVLITGGVDTQTHSLASAELYDPTTGTFNPTGSMTTNRAWHTATLLADGRVLIAGGAPAAWSARAALASAEIYDPTTGTFTATDRMTGGREFHSATLLDDGRVLVTGGWNGVSTELASAEIYDPNTGTFTLTGPMTATREYQTATLLADGRVLVAGGGGDYTNRIFLASAELYDPDSGTFTATGAMADARTNHAAIVLDGVRVLVTGGYGAVAPLASAEIYDPTTGTFSPAGSGG
jgi:hypothetical protein